MYLTQQQIDVLSQNLRKKRLRLELLDFNMKTIDRIEGLAIDGSISADADNDIRRSGNVQMAIPIDSRGATLLNQLDGFVIDLGGKIWLDKNIKIYIGIDDIATGDTVWYKLGVFLINKPIRTFNATQYIISFNCIDLMAKLTGQRQGQLTGTTTLIEKGYYSTNSSGEKVYNKQKLADAVISTISELGGFTRYRVAKIPTEYEYLPYDIKIGVGGTVYDILKEFKSILSTWQMYFDLDGIFVFEPIPSGKSAIVYHLDKDQYISDEISCDFENVKNQVVVYGRCNTLSYYTENTDTVTDNVVYDTTNNKLILKFDTVNSATFTIGGVTFGFKSLTLPNTSKFTQVEIYDRNTSQTVMTASLVKFENSTKSFGITYSDTSIEPNSIEPNEIYFIRIYSASKITDDEYVDLSGTVVCEFMGKQAVSYCLVNDNTESPFYVNANLTSPNFYAGKATSASGETWGEKYTLTLNNSETLSSLSNGTIVTFMANAVNIYGSGQSSTYINIKDGISGTTLLSNVPLVQNKWEYQNNVKVRPSVVQNKLANDYTIYQLRYETYTNENNTIVSQFVLIGRCASVITKVFSSGEYDNIYADQLAYERCLWELFQHSNMNDNISLEVVPNYLIDVNCKIEYDSRDAMPNNVSETENLTTKTAVGSTTYEQFQTVFGEDLYVKKVNIQSCLTKKITYPLGLTNTAQSITAIRIYDSGNLVSDE